MENESCDVKNTSGVVFPEEFRKSELRNLFFAPHCLTVGWNDVRTTPMPSWEVEVKAQVLAKVRTKS